MSDDLPKLRSSFLGRQINFWVDDELRRMYDLLRENNINASEIARRTLKKAFQEALKKIEKDREEIED